MKLTPEQRKQIRERREQIRTLYKTGLWPNGCVPEWAESLGRELGCSPAHISVINIVLEDDLDALLSHIADLEAELARQAWIPTSERLPEPSVDVLIWNVAGFVESGHLDANNGQIITRPLTAPGEIVRQWPAWAVNGDDQNYHEASHWRPLPAPPEKP